jgi:DNA-directed RNA polymerase subunit RPC12/RpoP
MSELYICIDCELANAQAQPTALNEHGYCPRCGSSSVVPVDTLVELDAKRKRADAVVDTTEKTKHRIQAMKDQRKRDSRPLMDYLKSLIKPNTTERSHLSACFGKLGRLVVARSLPLGRRKRSSRSLYNRTRSGS